jgi:hypothetical protein
MKTRLASDECKIALFLLFMALGSYGALVVVFGLGPR